MVMPAVRQLETPLNIYSMCASSDFFFVKDIRASTILACFAILRLLIRGLHFEIYHRYATSFTGATYPVILAWFASDLFHRSHGPCALHLSISSITRWLHVTPFNLSALPLWLFHPLPTCHNWFTFFLFTYLIVTPDQSGRLSTLALGIPMLSLHHCISSLRYRVILHTLPCNLQRTTYTYIFTSSI